MISLILSIEHLVKKLSVFNTQRNTNHRHLNPLAKVPTKEGCRVHALEVLQLNGSLDFQK